jgi:hypothetical protein
MGPGSVMVMGAMMPSLALTLGTLLTLATLMVHDPP